jgi:mRNA-degrading endonuclease RelE of RelBE toxin-antitoxin system
MSINVNYEETIKKKLQDLSPELLEEVIDFIEFLKIKRMKKGHIDVSSLLLQQESLSRIWDSENEDVYEL